MVQNGLYACPGPDTWYSGSTTVWTASTRATAMRYTPQSFFNTLDSPLLSPEDLRACDPEHSRQPPDVGCAGTLKSEL